MCVCLCGVCVCVFGGVYVCVCVCMMCVCGECMWPWEFKVVGDWLFNLFRNVMAGHLCGGSCTCTSVLNGCSQYIYVLPYVVFGN